MKTDNWLIFIFSCLLLSLFINISQHLTIETLKYKIQKIEAGPARGLFDKTNTSVGDRMIEQLLKRILIDMQNKQLRDNTT